IQKVTFRSGGYKAGMGDPEQRVERILERGLERIDSPEAAHAVVTRLERLSNGATEAERGAAAGQPTADEAAAKIEQTAARAPSDEATVADVLDKVAQHTVAPTPAAETMVAAAQQALAPGQPVAPAAQRGRRLLKQAVLRRMGPLHALDARIYLEVNDGPHPGWLDSVAWMIALLFTGG